jgi:hypothetical protein
MSMIRRIPVALACMALIPALASADMTVNKAGVELVPPPGNTGAVAPAEQASTLREVKKDGGQTLRCWQNGRLLFESPGFREHAERQPNAVVIQRMDGDSVVVFDQHNSVCILSEK